MGHSERDPAREQLFLDQVASRRADGVILVTSAEPGLMATRKRHMPPVVAALETIEGQAFPTVRVDHRKASMDATNHLLALGHRRIAHIAGPQKSPMAAHRLEGFQAAMIAAGLDPAVATRPFALAYQSRSWSFADPIIRRLNACVEVELRQSERACDGWAWWPWWL